MNNHTFTIHGNHKSLTGNAVPKAKLTHGQQWTDKAQQYVLWKTHVVKEFLESLNGDPYTLTEMGNNAMKFGKPIVLKKEQGAKMSLSIYWNTENHADPESVFGSIADALFVNDKHLNGSFTYYHSKDKVGKVKVELFIY